MWTKNFLLPMIMVLLLSGCTPPQSQPSSTQPFFARAGNADHADASEVSANTPMQLPANHGSHPDYRLEWWYLTAVLEDDHGKFFGVQFTLFRIHNGNTANTWDNGQVWMAHASVHSQSHHGFEERFARGGVGNAAVSHNPFQLYMDDWQWVGTANDAPFPATLSVKLQDGDAFTLSLVPHGPYVRHGNHGISQKSADGSLRSYYYSQPFINVEGNIQIDGKAHRVHGNGWFDHEWTSHLARQDALGWDWFSLHLGNGKKLMAFRMHVKGHPPYITGSLIDIDGSVVQLTSEDILLKATAEETIGTRELPVRWRMTIPAHDIDIEIAPMKPGQWNQATFSYYEGAVSIQGSHSGNGFMELTGY